jgi:hypothetical protein
MDAHVPQCAQMGRLIGLICTRCHAVLLIESRKRKVALKMKKSLSEPIG